MPVPQRRTRLSRPVARKTEVFSGPDKRSSPGSAKTAEGRLRAIGIERGQPVGWCRHLSRKQIGNAQRTYKGLAPILREERETCIGEIVRSHHL
jgi:hypothetical protein